MSNLIKSFRTILNIKTILSENVKYISIYPALKVKEIREVQSGNDLTIYGENVPSGREQYLLKNDHPTACPVCASGLDIKHTDILILSQFVRSDGCMLPRRITGLCRTQQKRMSNLVSMAQKAGLMPNLNPAKSKKDPTQRYEWKKFNKYFDETTIKYKV